MFIFNVETDNFRRMAIFTQNEKNEPEAIARQAPMGQQIQIFQRMCEWHRVDHIPIFKENICLPLTKDQWVTIIILNNSQVPEMTMIKYSKHQQRNKNQRSRCREQNQSYIRSGFIQNARDSGKVPAE